MKLVYKNKKIENVCTSYSYNNLILKEYGNIVAKKLPQRIIELKSFNSLQDVPTSLPFRRHKLIGKYDGCFAINITNQYRLIFRPLNGNDDLKQIDKIEILEVSKHYE